MEGIINLRGQIVPIISLRKRLGLPESGSGRANCIAVLDLAGELSGFLIDEVADVIRVSRSEILPPLDVAGRPWIEGILRGAGPQRKA